MEQKRTIWIVLAAGIFLSVVLGAAVILYSAEAKKNTTALYQRDNGKIWLSPESAEAKKANFLSNDAIVDSERELKDSNESKVSSITSNMDSPAEALPSSNIAQNDSAQTDNVTVISTGKTNIYNVSGEDSETIDLNSLREVSSTSSIKAQNKAAEDAIRETTKVHRNIEKDEVLIEKKYSSPQPKVTSSSNNSSKNVASAKPTTKAASTASNAKNVSSKYWVQAGSYTTTKNADEARSVLEANKIPCEVFTFSDAKNVLHYRVRVGPYTTKNEAEYWKKRIDTIPLFAKNGSYVTSTNVSK